MSRQYWAEGLYWAVADGTAIFSSTTETILFPNVTIPANYAADARWVKWLARGRHSTTSTPTLRFRLRWGGVSGTVLWDSGTITCGSSITAGLWKVEGDLIVRSNGASGTIFAGGEAILGAALAPTVGSATGAAALGVFGSAGDDTPAAVTVDLTADTALSLTAQWGTNSASNTITGHQYFGASMN